jgi:hypothetical protein
MKLSFHKTRWSPKTFRTPHIGVIVNDDHTQISFVVANFHFWVIVK